MRYAASPVQLPVHPYYTPFKRNLFSNRLVRGKELSTAVRPLWRLKV